MSHINVYNKEDEEEGVMGEWLEEGAGSGGRMEEGGSGGTHR